MFLVAKLTAWTDKQVHQTGGVTKQGKALYAWQLIHFSCVEFTIIVLFVVRGTQLLLAAVVMEWNQKRCYL